MLFVKQIDGLPTDFLIKPVLFLLAYAPETNLCHATQVK